MISRSAAKNSSCWPGSVRQSMVAVARPGITFSLYPAASRVGLAVLRSVAPMIGATAASFEIAISGSSRSISRPRTSDTASRNARTVGVITTGNRCRPSRATASHSTVTALSSWIIEPCPGRPRATRRSHWMPFWAVSIRYSRRSSLIVYEKPPTSPIASVHPSNSSAWLSTMKCAPYRPPASSSARNASTRSRGGTRPSRRHWCTRARTIASKSFMSTAPRPHRYPSLTSPENGSTDHSEASAGTTSRWPWISNPSRPGSAPG